MKSKEIRNSVGLKIMTSWLQQMQADGTERFCISLESGGRVYVNMQTKQAAISWLTIISS